MWLLIAISAHFLNAVVFIGDRFLLSKKIPQPVIYSFYVGIFGGLALILVPLGIFIPELKIFIPQQGIVLFLSLVAGAANILALYFFYYAMQKFEASRVVPVIGAIIPIFTFFLATLFLNESLSLKEILAFFFLILGGFLMSFKKETLSFSLEIIKITFLAGFIFAISFTLSKFVYDNSSFIAGFFWPRIGGIIMAILFLALKTNRKFIFSAPKVVEKKAMGLIVLVQALGGLSFILLNMSIFLGSVTLINSLQGVQYVFLFILTVFLSFKFPQILKEDVSERIIIQKITAILLIGLGLAILAF